MITSDLYMVLYSKNIYFFKDKLLIVPNPTFAKSYPTHVQKFGVLKLKGKKKHNIVHQVDLFILSPVIKQRIKVPYTNPGSTQKIRFSESERLINDE